MNHSITLTCIVIFSLMNTLIKVLLSLLLAATQRHHYCIYLLAFLQPFLFNASHINLIVSLQDPITSILILVLGVDFMVDGGSTPATIIIIIDVIQPSKDLLEVPIGPVTRLRAKKFKEAFNGLLQDTWAKVDFKRICNNKEQALINLIHVQEGLVGGSKTIT